MTNHLCGFLQHFFFIIFIFSFGFKNLSLTSLILWEIQKQNNHPHAAWGSPPKPSWAWAGSPKSQLRCIWTTLTKQVPGMGCKAILMVRWRISPPWPLSFNHQLYCKVPALFSLCCYRSDLLLLSTEPRRNTNIEQELINPPQAPVSTMQRHAFGPARANPDLAVGALCQC